MPRWNIDPWSNHPKAVFDPLKAEWEKAGNGWWKGICRDGRFTLSAYFNLGDEEPFRLVGEAWADSPPRFMWAQLSENRFRIVREDETDDD